MRNRAILVNHCWLLIRSTKVRFFSSVTKSPMLTFVQQKKHTKHFQMIFICNVQTVPPSLKYLICSNWNWKTRSHSSISVNWNTCRPMQLSVIIFVSRKDLTVRKSIEKNDFEDGVKRSIERLHDFWTIFQNQNGSDRSLRRHSRRNH